MWLYLYFLNHCSDNLDYFHVGALQITFLLKGLCVKVCLHILISFGCRIVIRMVETESDSVFNLMGKLPDYFLSQQYHFKTSAGGHSGQGGK